MIPPGHYGRDHTIGKRTPHLPTIAAMIDTWDGSDAWGSAMTLAFAVADVAYAARVYEAVAALEYCPGAGGVPSVEDMAQADEDAAGDVSWEARELASAYLAGEVTDDDLIRAARVLSRYLDLCKRAGLDY